MRKATEELSYWLSIVLIAIVGIALFKVAAVRIGYKPLAELAAFI
jgi:hypothetical protein